MIGERLRNQRVRAHLSQREVAEAAGISPQRLNDIELDRGDLPTKGEIDAIYLALAIRPGTRARTSAGTPAGG